MDIHREGDFWVWEDLQKRLLLGIDSGRLSECLAEVKRRKAYGVFGNPDFGFREENLDFLADLPDIGSLWFWDIALKDVEGLYALTGVQSFGVHPKRPGIDFSRLPSLRDVFVHHNAKDSGLEAVRELEALRVWHYNPKHASFEGLAMPTRIHELDITWANPSSLTGLPELPRVKRVILRRCRNLKGIGELTRIAPNVEHLVVTNCPRVADGRAVVRLLPKLDDAYVRDEVLVTDGKLKFP